MQMSIASTSPFIPRPNEHERIVADLLDQRFFGPVAITTSLRGARGMGKTSLAREVCRDQRIVEAFPDGVVWVTVGQALSPLQLLSRIERLIYDLSGEQRGLTDLKAAEAHLRDLIHPRRVLLVLDECGDLDSVTPFLQTGPGGAVLVVSRSDDSLPLGARRTPVDIMITAEAVSLLAVGLADAAPREEGLPPAPMPFHSEGDELSPVDLENPPAETNRYPHTAEEEAPGEDELDDRLDAVDAAVYIEMIPQPADPALEAALRSAEGVFQAITAGLTAPAFRLLSSLAGQLNEWPILLTLVNGYLRGCLEPGRPDSCPSAVDALQNAVHTLKSNGLEESWAVNDALQRQRAVSAVLETCLAPLAGGVRQKLVDLVVFPLDEDIPLAAVSALWGTGSEETYTIASGLARRALISLDSAAWTLRLHPVVYEFVADRLRVGVVTDLHKGLVAGYAARCKNDPFRVGVVGWASGPDDGYFFQHLGSHLSAAGQRHELQTLLFDFNWLSAYLTCTNLLTGRRGDLYSLLLDFELALSIALDRQSAELRLIGDALRMAAPLLIRDPGQLAAQLLGRLLPFEEPEIQAMLRQAEHWTEEPWLRPLSACFSLPGGSEVRTIRGHDDWVTGLALLPDGQHAVSGSLDGSLRWWDLANGQNLRSILAHAAGISALAVTQDGRKVVTGGWDGKIKVWAVATGELLLEFEAHPDAVGALAVTPNGHRLVTGSDDRLVRVWDLASGKLQMELVGHGDPVRSLAVSPDGHTLISGSWDCAVRVWDLDDGSQLQFLTGHQAWVSAVVFLPGGGGCISAGWDRTVRVWNFETGEMVRAIEGFARPILALALTPSASRIIVGTGDGGVHLVDFAGGEILREFSGHTGGVNQIAITPEGRFAVTASDDRTLRIWDLVAIQAARSQPGHSAPVFAMQPLPDGKRSISASWDGNLKIWDMATGAATAELSGHSAGVIALAVSEDGRVGVSGSRDHTLKVWDLVGGSELRTLPGHAGAITTVSITPDGGHAVSGADDGTVKVWNLANGVCLAEFRGESSIWSCAVARDGKMVVASESSGKMYFLEIIQAAGGEN